MLFCLSAIASPGAMAAQCDYVVRNDWNSGFTVDLTITNTGATAIDGWEVGLEFLDGSRITGAWNVDLAGDNPYQAQNKGYNRSIAAGGSQSFGFNGSKANPGTPAPLAVLSGVCMADGGSGLPVAHATASSTSGTAPLEVQFDASQSQDTGGAGLSYFWDFGDGSSSTAAAPTKTFDVAGQ
ncbi:MAG: cellulose binding domain-containing protein [Pseudomonadota bacterium]